MRGADAGLSGYTQGVVRFWERFRREREPDDASLVMTARYGGRARIRESDVLVIEGEDLFDADFSGRRLEDLSVGDSRLTRCRFERMTVESVSFGTGLRPTVYTECSFDGSQIGGTGWGRARFVRCSFRGVRLRGLFGFDAEFVDCVFTGRAEHCVFNGAPNTDLDQVRDLADRLADVLDPAELAALRRRIDEAPPDRTSNEFRGNDFSGMELIDVDFRDGIDLTAQRFPPGDDYAIVADPRAAIARARGEVRFWDEDAGREFALAMMRHLAARVEHGQEQLYLRRADWTQDDTRRALFDLLAGH